MRRDPPLARVPAPVPVLVLGFTLLALLSPLLLGCGVPRETGSARERDEQRTYGRVVVRSEVTPRRVTLGDPGVWTLTATLPPTCEPLAVRLDSVPASLDLVPRGEPAIRTSRGALVWSRRYDLRGFDLGALALPGARLAIRVPLARGGASNDTLQFPFDSLAVDSLTPAATGAASPDRGPIDPGLRPVDLAVAGAIVAVVAAILVFLLLAWRRRRGHPEAVAPAEPAETRFDRALEALRHDGPALARDAFHERLSGAIRHYVGEVTEIDAIDLTTRELEREMGRSPRARPDAAAEIVRILRRSDLVKFARRADAWEEARALLDDAALLSGSVYVAPPAASAVAPALPAERPRSGTEEG